MQKEKRSFFNQQPIEQNNTAEQSDKLQQQYTYKNHSHKENSLIRDSQKMVLVLRFTNDFIQ